MALRVLFVDDEEDLVLDGSRAARASRDRSDWRGETVSKP